MAIMFGMYLIMWFWVLSLPKISQKQVLQTWRIRNIHIHRYPGANTVNSTQNKDNLTNIVKAFPTEPEAAGMWWFLQPLFFSFSRYFTTPYATVPKMKKTTVGVNEGYRYFTKKLSHSSGKKPAQTRREKGIYFPCMQRCQK